MFQIADGLILEKTSSPLGVLIIFESRPDALVQVIFELTGKLEDNSIGRYSLLCSAQLEDIYNHYSICCTTYSPRWQFPVTTADYVYADSITDNSQWQ